MYIHMRRTLSIATISSLDVSFSSFFGSVYPPKDGGGFKGFYHNWMNSFLQQLKRNFWEIADALFRIS
jgi:hypothetical protein